MEQVVRLQKLANFGHGAMDDRIDDNGAEKSGRELSTFLEVLRPFAARLGKSESALVDMFQGVCARRTFRVPSGCITGRLSPFLARMRDTHRL